MDPRLGTIQQELHNVQTDVKQVSFVQLNHEERLVQLERRHADDAAKSAWNSPFPSVLGGTPQHGPVHIPSAEPFDNFAVEQSTTMLGSLHLDTEDEPVRRGAASRANSVRFDEATLQGNNWSQNARNSGDFGSIRPGSGLGMERSLSHKSDGRHSSAGHSIHSVHSIASGRASSLALDDLVLGGRDDDSPLEATAPAPGLLFMGSVPSIVRCWLTTQYAHDTLRYAVICSGSQKSTIEYRLVKALELEDSVLKDLDGSNKIRMPVYLAEASVVQQRGRAPSPSRQIPFITADFEVISKDEAAEAANDRKGIGIFIASDTLRYLGADILLSQNRMTLWGNGEERERISVPFVRPEDDNAFKYITTVNIVPNRPRLNAAAREFISGDSQPQTAAGSVTDNSETNKDLVSSMDSPSTASFFVQPLGSPPGASRKVEIFAEPIDRNTNPGNVTAQGTAPLASSDDKRSDSRGIWRSWRQGSIGGKGPGGELDNGQRDSGLSGYQPAGRGARQPKILKPLKSTMTSTVPTRVVTSNDAVSGNRNANGEARKRSQGQTLTLDGTVGASNSASARWETAKRNARDRAASPPDFVTTPISPEDNKTPVDTTPATRSNPVGGASAFSWMSGSKPLGDATNSQRGK